MPSTKTIFDIAAGEAERRVEQALIEGATVVSLAYLPIECLPLSLTKLANLVSLDLSSCTQLQDLQPLASLTSLQSLDLSYCAQLQDLQPLASLTSLQSLNLSSCTQLEDLQPLAVLTSLQSLNLSSCTQLEDLQPLAGLTSLQSLNLRYCTQLQDPQPLASLTSLQSLNLSYCTQLEDLQPLAGLTGLQSLDLSYCEQLEDLQPLAGLTRLQSLDLSSCTQLRDLQPLAGLTSLQSLNLRYCTQLQDPQPLASLTSLQSLYLRYCTQLNDLQPLASLTSLQSLDLSFCTQLRDLQPLASLTSLQSLNLSSCTQLQDLQPLAGLTSLQSLNLSSCTQLQDLQLLASLTGLQSLNLSYCTQLQDLQPLAVLTSLQSLNLGYCTQLQDLQPLAGLTSLQSLNLSTCTQLQDLQPLASLTGLQSLNLRYYTQLQDLQPLAGLTSLQSLNLSSCKQLQDVHSLAVLTSLQSLDLSLCEQLQDLQPLAVLTSLQSLDLSLCEQLQDLQPLASLTSLQSLDLSFCQQLQELQPLAGLTSLQSLDLSYCTQLQELQPLAGLTSLQSLNLSYCTQLQDLQPLTGLTSLQSFSFFDCLLDCSPAAEPTCCWPLLSELHSDTLAGAPSELGSESTRDNVLPPIRAWQKDLLAGEAQSSILKVFILGNGRVGKTQIRGRLLGRDFDPSIPSTHAIRLEELTLAPATAKQPEVRAKLWDFGGQSIYLGTHGLFLDDRAIYIIAWSPQFENAEEAEQGGIVMRNRPLAYWLAYVRSLAGPRAPVIVTQTQCDRELEVRMPPLAADHGFDRLRTTYSSAKQPDGIERLQIELKSAARYQLEQYGKVRLPLSWCSVAEELDSRKPQKTISYSEFEALSRTKHKTAVASTVLNYLHRSGQAFYRAGTFGNQVVLDLEWALDGIYAVLDRDRALPLIRRQAGRFSPHLLGALVWQKYGPAEHALFLSLMQQCQICFKVADDLYVAPALLPSEHEVSGSINQVWRAATPDASADLHYLFLHEGILRAMLSGLGEKAGVNAVYWAYGICFYDLETQSTARIRSEFSDPTGRKPDGRIIVEATGTQATVLVRHLVGSIQQLNNGTQPEVIWTKGGPQIERTDEGKGSTTIIQPFAAVKPAQPPRSAGELRPVYVSYAWEDESEALVDEFEARLPRNLKLVRDKRVLRPGDWISSFMQEIGRSDCVLVVLSEKYLKSLYCMRELLYLYQSSLGIRESFLDKLVPLTVGGVRFSRAIDRAEHSRYWESEDNNLNTALAQLGRLSIGDADRAEQLAVKDFAHRVSDILYWVADTLMPRGPDLRTKGIDVAIDLIVQRTQLLSRAAQQN